MVAMVRKLIRGRTAAGKRADKRASTPRAKAAKERRERKLNTKRYRNVPVKKATKPPKGIPIPPKPEKMSTAFKTKSGAKQVLKKFGVPGKIIAGVLAVAGGVGVSRKLNKPKTTKTKTKTKTPRPGNKSNAPNPFTKINPPAKRRGPGRPTMTSMVAKIPTPRNKNVTKRPKRPSKQGSFGR
tara:strand:+ start:38 stop:586 length:549 start_codon:yes stop_codon:yes gene_type:complete